MVDDDNMKKHQGLHHEIYTQ